MATITSTIKLVDQMTPTLNKISKAIDRVQSQTNKLNGGSAFGGLANGATRATKSSHNLYNALRRVAYTLMMLRGLKGAVDVADTMMNATARINNINDGLYTTAEYLDIIYGAAQRSRGSFSNMVASVGKLGTVAGDAFNNVNEMIAFTELMNKLFVLSGSSAAESSNAIYQLTQAMAAGRLQGDEMRSILENAPLLAQKIADHLGVTKGEIKKLGAEGVITADIIKSALFGAAEEIENKFANMPKTIGQIWTEIKNYCLNAFRPVIERIQKFINSPIFEKFKNRIFSIITSITNAIIRLFDTFKKSKVKAAIDQITNALSVLWGVASAVGSFMVKIATWICNNWSKVAPIVYTLVIALLSYKTVMFVASVVTAIAEFALWMFTTAAGQAFMWIMLFVAAIYLAVTAYNKFTGSSISATGTLLGIVAAAIAIIWDLVMGVLAALGTIGAVVVFVGRIIWTTFYNICQVLGSAIWNIIAFIINLVIAAVTAIVEIGNKISETLGWVMVVAGAIISNIFIFIGNLFIALCKSIAEVGSNISGTFVWIGAVLVNWGNNVQTFMSNLCSNLPLYWEFFKASVAAKFWGILVTASSAFTSLAQGSRDVALKMLKPFEGFANGVISLLNSIVRGWNSLCGKFTFTIPSNAATAYLGIGGQTVGFEGAKLQELSKVSAGDWVGDAGTVDIAGATGKYANAIARANAALSGIKPLNSNFTENPDIGDYANWGSVTDAFKAGMNTLDYKDLPEYDVNWGGIGDKIADAFDTLPYDDILAQWDNSGYSNAWGDFTSVLGQLWSGNNFKDPIEAFKNWYNKGDAFEDGVETVFKGIGTLIDGLFGKGSSNGLGTDDLRKEMFKIKNPKKPISKSLEDLLGDGTSGNGIGDALGAIGNNTGSSAGSLSNIEDTMDLAEEELELLRKLAEQEVINRFTTAEIHVDMTNNNNVSSNMDLDGIVTHLSNKLYQELGVVASGVHY